MDTPASLLERLRQPAQERDWARFVDLYTPLLYTWARRTGCQESDAADLVQEVLSLLVRKLPEFTYDRHKRFRGWLHTVARNCWRGLRRRARLPREPGAPDLNGLAAPDGDEPFWEVEYRQRLVARALELMRAELPSVAWKACWECVVEDRPPAEVARDLGIRVGTVYVAKSRVLSRLRQELAGLLE
jgi:RNA polymerase sigma-70 factor (ECF subfamily)